MLWKAIQPMGIKVKPKRTVAIAIVLTFAMITGAYAGLVKRTVEAQGTGPNLNQAIYDALDEAIGRINGKSIETRRQLDQIEVSQSDAEKENYYATEAYQQTIKTATKGVVDSYQILSTTKADNGLWTVKLSVTAVKFQTRDSNRKRIAVLPMRVGQGQFLAKGQPVDSDRITRIMTQNLVSTLVQSRRFTVLDREYIKETLGEQGLALSPNTPVAEIARLGQEMVADYIMVGTVETLRHTEQQVRMQSSGRQVMKRQGNIELSIRLIDVATRQIVFADFLKMRITDDDLQRFSTGLVDEGPDAAIAIAAADQMGRKIMETIYPLLIVAVQADKVTIGQGGSQIKVGDKLEVFLYGDRLVDPYTKEFLGREEIGAGVIEVTRVNPKQTHARIIESTIDIGATFEPRKYICRAVVEPEPPRKAAREERRKQRAARTEERDKSW